MAEYLYHYTNLSSLAMILKTKTLRLNSLKNMDDAEEVKTKNSDFLGKYCFVSSWTDDENESIPLWNLYTYNMTGIRIKMCKNPFVFEQTKLYYYEDLNRIFDIPFAKEIMHKNNLYYYPNLPLLRKVNYTKDENLIFPEPINYLHKNSDGTFDITGNFIDINKYKRDSWQFQNEWRYGLLFFPHDAQGRLKMQLEVNANDMPFWHIDLPLSDEALNDIEIVTGPRMTEGDKILLKSLIDTYCPSAIIKDSQLKIN